MPCELCNEKRLVRGRRVEVLFAVAIQLREEARV
jgi:hypothetical protein